MAGNCGLHCHYYTNKVVNWLKNNKVLTLLVALSFCLFVSTLTMASQRNSARDELAALESGVVGCQLSLKTDFGAPSPVFLRNGAFLAPDAKGAISLRRSETVLAACPGNRHFLVLGNQTTSYNALDAHCIVDSTFRVDRWIGRFEDIKCSAQPWISSEKIGGCVGSNELHKVGYIVKSVFHELYRACFDAGRVETLYVEHQLAPSSLFIQQTKRPNFIEGDLFKTVNMAQLYKVKSQQERVQHLVGSEAENFISNNEYITRGHLAARADFSLGAEQRASFHYVNTAPQWRAVNAGAWAAVEDGIRRRVNSLGRPVTVYTGTIGVSTLLSHLFYLGDDQNNNGVVPVPMYFFKLVYDPRTKTAVVFLSLNISSLTTAAPDQLYICESVCELYPWLRWRGQGNACCSYEDVRDHLRVPPQEVNGLFHL